MEFKVAVHRRGAAMVGGAALLGWLAFGAQADTYRCTTADGKTTYQEYPCMSGSQKAIDDSTARARRAAEEKEKKRAAEFAASIEKSRKTEAIDMAELRRDFDETLRANKLGIQDCLEAKNCDSYTYTMLLKGLPRSFVLEVLGQPEHEQRIGGIPTHYFTVPAATRSGRARLQISYTFAVAGGRFNKLGLGAMVESVNVY